MRKLMIHILFVLFAAVSCVTPNELDVIDNTGWVAFGLSGTGKTPVIFIYHTGNTLVYHYSAKITYTDMSTGEIYVLQKVEDDPDFVPSREFPFPADALGHIVYYTNEELVPAPGNKYRVDLDLGVEQGTAEITMPLPEDFTDVQLDQNRNGTAKLVMTIPVPEAYTLYKYEILVDQYVDVNEPTDYDPVTGEPVAFTTVPHYVNMVITPNNYITPDRLAEDPVFVCDLNENLPDFEYTDENYQLNVRLRRYGTELAEYFQSVDIQSDAWVTDPFTEPVFIRSNLDGILGVIGTYAYSDDLLLEYQR